MRDILATAYCKVLLLESQFRGSMRRLVFTASCLFISALFLWLALRDVPFSDVARSISQANLLWVLISMSTMTLSLYARAVRWRGLLGFRVHKGHAFYILTITVLLNLLPLRVGELARGFLVTRSGVPLLAAATSIVVERLLDTLVVVLMVAAGLNALPNTIPTVSQVAALFGIAAVTGLVVLILFAYFPRIPHRVLHMLEARVAVLKRLHLRLLVAQMLDGLQPLTHWRSATHAIVWTVISWVVSLYSVITLERALGIEGVNQWLLSILTVSLATLSAAIPVSIAAIGPFEGAVRLAGEGVRLSPVIATSLGFLVHGVTILSYAILGTLGLLALGVSPSEVIGTKKVPQPEDSMTNT